MIVGLLSRRFSLSLSLLLSRSFSSLLLPLYCFSCQSLSGWHSFFLSSFSRCCHSILHESEFLTNEIISLVVRRPGEKEYVCVCMLLLLLLTSHGCSAREKNVCTKGRELIKHFRRFATWFIDKSIKICTYTYGSKRKDRYYTSNISSSFFVLIHQ